ncbi:MAG: hypothetical protein AB2374_19320, partial [Cytobacillus gottheilii]
ISVSSYQAKTVHFILAVTGNLDLDASLVLNKYFLSLFGKSNFKELSEDMRMEDLEGYNEENNSYFYELIIRKYLKLGFLNKEKLKEYDENIYQYVRHISENRDEISLKYFQYLSILFTEMYLDRFFLDREKFVDDLNKFVQVFNNNNDTFLTEFDKYSLNKLAYMSATGSGKTLIMHVNILQYKKYINKAKYYDNSIRLNKIILLTPNEGLSNQHIEELRLSNIPCNFFEKDLYKMNQKYL